MIAGMSFSAGKIVVRMWNVLQKKNHNNHYKIDKKYFKKVALHSSHIINAMSLQHVTQKILFNNKLQYVQEETN